MNVISPVTPSPERLLMFFRSPVSHSVAKTPHPALAPGTASNQSKQVSHWFSLLTARRVTETILLRALTLYYRNCKSWPHCVSRLLLAIAGHRLMLYIYMEYWICSSFHLTLPLLTRATAVCSRLERASDMLH